jgi:hypothetical protein
MKLRGAVVLAGLCLAQPAAADQGLNLPFLDRTDDSEAPHPEPSVHVPEPMVFDLVRGLGAHRGEFEVNVLSQFPINRRNARTIDWAPEVEYAIIDGLGLELELPFKDDHLEAIKLAAQMTFSSLFRRPFLHGVQVIGEYLRTEEAVEVAALYVPAFRFHEHLSGLAMIGVRTEFGGEAERPETFLLNGTLFLEESRESAAAVELNFAATRDTHTLLVMPQIMHEITENWTIQAGAGVELGEAEKNWIAAARLIWGTEGPTKPHAAHTSMRAVARRAGRR